MHIRSQTPRSRWLLIAITWPPATVFWTRSVCDNYVFLYDDDDDHNNNNNNK